MPTSRRSATVRRSYLGTAVLVVAAVLLASCGSDTNTNQGTSLLGTEPAPDLLPPAGDASASLSSDGVSSDGQADVEVGADGQVPAEITTFDQPSALSCLSTRARVAQLLLPLATQPELAGARAFAASGELGGIGLLGAPDEGLVAELEALQQSSFVPVLVASDEEGGAVQRLGDLLGPLPSAASDAGSKTPSGVQSQWLEYGSRVRALGVSVIFGPVLDVGAAPGIESRSYGDDPAVVASFGRAVAAGLLEAGITPVFKHFPGHGRATADSHLELPTTPSLSELRTLDLLPYVEILADPLYRDRAGVMIAHLSVPGLSDEVPTSLSPETITGLLRGELGFGGLVFTDAMNMGAIIDSYGTLEALELALVAGADIAILGSLADLTPALDHLSERADSDPNIAAVIDNRVERVLVAKGQGDLCQGAS